MEKFDVEFEDEVEREEYSNLCDFLFPFLMFIWLHFDVPFYLQNDKKPS
jgi:hypothetical protein